MKRKIFTLLFTACIVYTNAFTQPVISGQKTLGGNNYDIFKSMYFTRDGGLIVGGESRSNISGEKTENNRGPDYTSDYWVVKFDSLKKIQWDKTIGGNSNDGLSSLQQTRDGGYILGGGSSSNVSGEKTENSRGEGDYWLVKLDKNGKIQWDKTIGGSGGDVLTSLQQTSDGEYILGGYSYSNISGEKSQNSRGSADYWVVKIGKLGNIQWDKTIGGNGNDDLNALQQTSDGGYILGGWSNSNISGEKTENSRGLSDYWVVKLDAFGKIQWDKTIGGNRGDNLQALQQTSDGGYILGGYSNSGISGEKTQKRRGDNDYWAVNLDDSGNIQWDKTIGGSSNDRLYSLQQTTDGGYILGGYSSSNMSGEKTENSRGLFNADDYWIVKLNAFGKIRWDKTIGGNDVDQCYIVKEIARNSYLIGGTSNSGISGDKTQRSRGGSDYWIVKLKYNKPDSTNIISSENKNNLGITNNNSSKEFIVYPNPAKDILHVQTNGNATLTLTDQSGKILFTKNIRGKGDMNVANLAAGLYYLKNNATGKVQKVLVSK